MRIGVSLVFLFDWLFMCGFFSFVFVRLRALLSYIRQLSRWQAVEVAEIRGLIDGEG